MTDEMDELWFHVIMGIIGICLIWVVVTVALEKWIPKASDMCGYWTTQNNNVFRIYETYDVCYIQFNEFTNTKNADSYQIHYDKGNTFFFIANNERYELTYSKKCKELSITKTSNCLKISLEQYSSGNTFF